MGGFIEEKQGLSGPVLLDERGSPALPLALQGGAERKNSSPQGHPLPPLVLSSSPAFPVVPMVFAGLAQGGAGPQKVAAPMPSARLYKKQTKINLVAEITTITNINTDYYTVAVGLGTDCVWGSRRGQGRLYRACSRMWGPGEVERSQPGWAWMQAAEALSPCLLG